MYFKCRLLSVLLLLLGITKGIKCLDFCFNATMEGFRLNDVRLQTRKVSSMLECVMLCVQDSCCRSVNYKDESECAEESECELLHNTVYNTSRELKRNISYDHISLDKPLKEYNASCIQKESCVKHYEVGEREDGIYVIDPDGLGYFEVKCQMSLGSGGWTVMQRRQDGSVDFFRNWMDYKNGFGNLATEFWLGLDKIHRLTKSGHNSLRIDMTEWGTDKKYRASYSSFSVSGENEQYQLQISGYTGNAQKDSMAYQNGRSFFTKDKDVNNCAHDRKSGWWHRHCTTTNANGPYQNNDSGLYWITAETPEYTYIFPKTFQMAVQPSLT